MVNQNEADWTNLVATLRERTPIAEVIERTGPEFELVPEGHELRGKYHDSLVVTPAKGLYQWHSQGEAGDVFTWLQNRNRCSFATAVAMLEGQNIPVLPFRPAQRAPEPEPEPLPQDLHLRFHRALDDAARGWWLAQGISEAGVDRFFLGVCDHEVYGRCYTIPILEGGKLVNLRMRLHTPRGNKGKDKYRPYAHGYGTQLFNSDILVPGLASVVITAGEKKAVVCWEHNIPAVSPTGGCDNWRPEWTTRLQFCQRAYIAFDPTETPAAWKLAEKIGDRAFVVTLPAKPDDFLDANGADAFRQALRDAQPYADREYWQRRMGGRSPWSRLLNVGDPVCLTAS